MLKKVSVIASAFLLGLSVTTQAVANDVKIAFVDSNEVFAKHPVPAVFFEGLEAKRQQLLNNSDEAKAISKELQQVEEEARSLQANREKMKKAVFSKKVQQIKAKLNKLQERKLKADEVALKQLDQEIQKRKTDAIKLLQQEISEFAKQEKVDVVLEMETITPIHLDEKLDITQKVIDYIKKKYDNR